MTYSKPRRTLIGLLALSLISLSGCAHSPTVTFSQPSDSEVEQMITDNDYYWEMKADLDNGEITEAQFRDELSNLAESLGQPNVDVSDL